MVTWGERFQGQRLGVGVQIPPGSEPKPFDIDFTNFRFGLMLGERPGDLPEGYYSFALDVETSPRDGARRTAGITLIENTGHSLQHIAFQAGLDFQSALVAFDPPYIGIKEGPRFLWNNINLESYGDNWVSSNYGDVLLFSNGKTSYYRDPETGIIAVVQGMPGAGTIFTAFGRVFVGNTVRTTGEVNVLGLAWNGVDGDYRDWTGTGIGEELLLVDAEQSDKIMAGKVLSYNTVAILCRRSLWIGERTNAFDRPLDPIVRLTGIGCVAEPTAKTTEAGVTFLSDEGVRHFDGQTAVIISGAINQDILPIDFTQIGKYKATWDSGRRRYILCTPVATYIYQFPTPEYPKGAWFKKSIRLDNVITFAEQFSDPTWNDMGEVTWDGMLEQTWLDLGTPESPSSPQLLCISGTQYGYEDVNSEYYFGTLMSPVFEPRPKQSEAVDLPDRVFLTQGFSLQYAGGGTIKIFGRKESGEYEEIVTAVLPPVVAPRYIHIDALHSSRAIGIAIKLITGDVEILRIRQTVLDNGPALSDMVTEDHIFTSAAPTGELTTEANTTLAWQYNS